MGCSKQNGFFDSIVKNYERSGLECMVTGYVQINYLYKHGLIRHYYSSSAIGEAMARWR